MPHDDAPVRVLAVAADLPSGLGPDVEVEATSDLASGLQVLSDGGIDVVLVPWAGGTAAIDALLDAAPDVPVVVLTEEEDGVAAIHAGALEFVPPGADADTVRRAIRYAVSLHRMEAEVRRRQLVDERTGVFNARGFELLATHHLRLADRARHPVVLVFVRLDGLANLAETRGTGEADRELAETARILCDAVREVDVVARVGADAFCVLLAGAAEGTQTLVLSRLVEAAARRNALAGGITPLEISVGAATYDPVAPVELEDLLAEADRRMRGSG